MSLRRRVRDWLGPDKAPPPPGDDTPELGAHSAEQAKRFREAIDDIRKNANVSAKALTALGSAALSALAIEKFADIFPLKSDSFWATVAALGAVVGFFAVAGALAWFTSRLWRVDAPVGMSPSKQRVEADAESFDKEAVRKALHRFDETARLNAAPSLEAYSARGRRFERIARRLPENEARRDVLFAQANEIRNDVDATMAHVAADVVRSRSREVITGRRTKLAGILFVAGLAAIAVGADYLDGERAGQVAVAKECAAMGKALSEQIVVERGAPAICNAVLEGGSGASDAERSISRANGCAAAVKALTDGGLDTAELTGANGPCKKAPADGPPTKAGAVSAALPTLLDQAAQCERASGKDSCSPLYRLIEAARTPGE